MITTFKFLYGLDKCDSSLIFTLDQGVYRGHSLKLFKKCTILDLKKHPFGYRVVDDWNSLEKFTVTSQTLGSLKHVCTNM